MDSKDVDCFDIKISDFGFACFFYPKNGLNLSLRSGLYMAPEILNKQNYNEKVDIWSIGIITYALLTGKSLFPN